MIRYVSQKQVDLNRKPKSLRQGSTELKEIRTEGKPSHSLSAREGAEDEENSTVALRQLKRANDQKEMLRGRLSFLQIEEEKNQFRAFMNDQRYQFHQQMRDQLEKERQEKARHMRMMHQKLLEAQERARQEREQHNANLRQAQGELNRSKVSDFKETKEQREEIERSLSQLRREESNLKRSRKQEIKEYQKMQRSNVQEYMRSKMQELKANDSEAVRKFSQAREERARQIEELSRLQAEMLEKQARSRAVSDESAQKLRKLLNEKKPVSTSHTTKLPSLSPPGEIMDILAV